MDKIYSASCIANYFIENTKSIDNLRLNKFVYIAYGLALVYKERELFKDRIEAWEYGPVIPAIYHEFKKYKDKKIIEQSYILDQNGKKEFPSIDKKDKDAKEVLDAVIEIYGGMSVEKLLDFMHEKNSPWTECYKKGHRNIEIDKKKIKNYYPVFRDRIPNIETVIAILSEPDPEVYNSFQELVDDICAKNKKKEKIS